MKTILKMLYPVIILGVLACSGDYCQPSDFQCSRDIIEICNEDYIWEVYRNCGAIGTNCYDSPGQCDGYYLPCCN